MAEDKTVFVDEEKIDFRNAKKKCLAKARRRKVGTSHELFEMGFRWFFGKAWAS